MKIRAVLFVVLTATLSLNAATPVNGDGPYNLSHTVPVTLGRTTLQPEDKIVIDSIRGTADTITSGNVYRVDGHYALGSCDEAQLAINVTNGQGDSHAGVLPKDLIVTRGEGTFSLYFRMNAGGDAHLSFYPAGHGGASFASVYFNGPDAWSQRAGSPVHDVVQR